MADKTEATYTEFGRLVRERRKELRMTQEGLAAIVGLSRTSITNIEKGRQRVLLHQVFAIADALKSTPEMILPDLRNLRIESDTTARLSRRLAQF